MAGNVEGDHYSTLGADVGASVEEIERLYKLRAREHHPDRGGDEERMKAINAAYRVLRDPAERRAYDEAHGLLNEDDDDAVEEFVPLRTPAAQADALGGRLIGAWLCTLAGLVLLLLVRFHYVKFLWPLALLAGAVVFLGVMMAHGALAYARRGAGPNNLFARFVWAQEFLFWSAVCAGLYGIYLLLTAI